MLRDASGPSEPGESPALAVITTVVPGNGGFQLDTWLPHEFSLVANRFSAVLAGMYSQRFGISVTGWRVIAVLANHAPLSAKELAERTAMNQVGITRAVSELMRVGMVRRRTDAKDRRRVVLRLSDKGVAAYREVIPIAIRMEAELLKGIQPEEVTRLRETMTRLARHAETLFGDGCHWENFRQNVRPERRGRNE